MEYPFENKDFIKNIFREIKPVFTEKLGKYTHQRISGDWHFHGLAFVKDEMTYVFGFNVGFFRRENDELFDHVGMNVLVRLEGPEEEIRNKFAEFFRENLKYWYNNEEQYSSFRGTGSEFLKYKKLNEFKTEQEIIDFLTHCIVSLNVVYLEIIKNPENIFDNVLRAAYPWHDSIIDICDEAIKQNK